MSETHDINVEVDGTRFDGAWSNVMGEMIVYYNGFTASTHPVPEDPDTVAKDMLSNLVREHFVDLGTLPNSIPEGIRESAHRFMNADMDDEFDAIEDLVHSLGDSSVNSLPYQQLAWLCVNSLSMIVPSWKHMCDDDAAELAHAKLLQILLDATSKTDFESMATPLIAKRNGAPVVDCDECRLTPTAEAIANTATFMRTGESSAAINAIWSAYNAYEEGCHTDEAPEKYSEWLVLQVLQPSLACKPIHSVA